MSSLKKQKILQGFFKPIHDAEPGQSAAANQVESELSTELSESSPWSSTSAATTTSGPVWDIGNYISDDVSIGKQTLKPKNASLRMPGSQGDMLSPSVVQESCVFSIVGFQSGDDYSTVNMQMVLSVSTAVFLLLMVLVLEARNWDN
ncbi:uncharacterized protein LOC143231142 [Tachypleus tridentatus]|uniref:uncharacterized protein LOC143231142 n=1 Tax=Tachypleus tridentatus TaxID=6853 RepID=UPI003FCF4976